MRAARSTSRARLALLAAALPCVFAGAASAETAAPGVAARTFRPPVASPAPSPSPREPVDRSLRPLAKPFEIDVGDLPVASLTPEPRAADGAQRGEAPHGGGVVHFGDRVSVTGHAFGGIVVGDFSAPFGAYASGGLSPSQSRGVATYAWEGFDLLPSGELSVERGAGLYDVERRHAFETWRAAPARALP